MMDSSQYYTGATLFRGNKFLQQQQQQQLSLGPPPPHQQYGGGPPLLMQPRTPGETRNLKNLFSGMPLIRANSSDGSISKYLGTPPPTPPGVICFQPFYYIQHPPPPPPPPQQHQQQQIIHQHKKQQLHHQNLIIHPRDQPKRKNYKALQQINGNGNGNGNTNGNGNGHGHQQYQKIPATKQMSCPPNIPVELNKSKLVNESSEPIMINSVNSTSLLNLRKSPTLGPIGSPLQNRSKSPSSNTNTNGFGHVVGTYNGHSSNGNNGLVNGKSFESLLSAEKLQKQNIEEKERSDRLLNFYFYEEHWRPKEPSSGSDSNADDEDSSWGQNSSLLPQNQPILELNHILPENSVQMLSPSTSPSYQNCQNQATPTSSNSNGKIQNNQHQSKDLNIETQIVTLANGHRDLEIRLFFPQIVKS